MKNVLIKKKVVVSLSIIGGLLSLIALIIGIVFVYNAKNVIDVKMNEYNINTATVLWISKQGRVFFGNSSGLGIIGLVLGILGLLIITGLWIIAGIKKKIKKAGSAGSIVGVGSASIATVVAVASIGLLVQGSILFKESSNVNKTIEYFEKNAESIAKNKEDASKAALLYTLANKEGISSFSAVSSLQISMSGLLFGDMKISSNPTLAGITNADPNKYIKIFKDPEIIKDFNNLDSKVQFIDPKTQAKIGGKKWLDSTVASLPLSGGSKDIASAIIKNIDSWNEMINGNYPAIHKMISSLMQKGSKTKSVVWSQIPIETQKILEEFGFVKKDSDGEFIKDGAFNTLQKLIPSSIKFEKRVVGTLGKLLELPYATQEEKLKTRLTILEWLNTIVNSIDYISKNQKFEVVGVVDSTYPNGQTFEKAIITSQPQNVYGGTYHKDGTISVETTKDKFVGTINDSMYDIKLKLMEKVLDELHSDKLLNKIRERQKNITASSFAEHIMKSEGLKALTGQYAIFNYNYDENDKFGKIGYAKHIQETCKKINDFIN